MRFSHKNQMKKWSMALVLLMVLQIMMPMIQVLAQETDSNTNSADEKGLEDTFISDPISEDNDAEVRDVEVQSTESEDAKAEDVEVQSTEVKDAKIQDTKTQDDTDLQEEGKDATPASKKEGSTFDIKSGGKDLGNIFTFNFLRLGGKDGEDIEDGDILNIVDGTKVALQFAWDTVGLNAVQGDWAAIQLPDVFKLINISNQDIKVDSENGSVSVGKYSINNGELRFVFNENIEDIKNGFIGFDLEFDLIKFKENIEQKIEFKDSKNKTLTVIAKPIGDISSINKEGDPDKKHDAKEIYWIIDILNTEEEAIKNASLKDVIPEGLELKANSFVIKELTVNYEGKKVPGKVVTASPSSTSDGFEIAFDSIAPYKGYQIQYTTTIKDYSKATFSNDATLSYGNKNLAAKATVGGLTRSNMVEKSGSYNPTSALIEWTIDVNKSGGTIEEAIVEDNLPQGLAMVSGSIEVFKIENIGGTWKETKTDIKADEFPINLGKLGTEDAYRIKFKSSIDYSKINDGNYQKINEFINKTELKDGEITVGEAEKKVTITRDSILSKTGKSNVNYENKTLTWTLEVNKANHPLTGVKLTDLIPAGLNIKASDIVVKNQAGTVVNIVPTITKISTGTDIGKTKIEINLGDIGTEKYTITYTTTVEDFTIDTFSNTASLSGIGVGEGGSIVPVPITPPQNTFAKTYKDIDYNAKTMDWELRVNPVKEAISELKIVDSFPNKGLILLPDTLVVKVGSTPLSKGIDYTLTPNTEGTDTGYHKGFTITLNSLKLPLNNLLVITYKTSYDPQVVVEGNTLDPHINQNQIKVYKNKAQFIGKTVNNNDINTPREANHTVREDSWNSGKKEGQLVHLNTAGAKTDGWVSGAERKIAWQLYINYQEQNLGTGVEVVDTLAYKGTIDQASIKVSEYKVNKNGTTAITGPVLPKANYNVSFDEDGKFTLKFADAFTVDKRYVIEFLTSVPDISQNKYTNNAVVKVGGKEFPYDATISYNKHDKFLDKNTIGLDGKNVFTGDEVNWEVKVNESLSVIKDAKIVDTISKGLVYVNDSLKVYKLIGNQEIELKEVRDYDFSKSNTGDGKTVLTLNFTDDVDSTLLLKYKTVVTATQDMVNNKVEFSGIGIVTITKESQSLSARQFSYIGGVVDPKKGMLEVSKWDSEEEKLINNNEAQFTLWYKLNGNYVQFGDGPFTTNKGVLTIKNLPLRTYYLREAKAPEGYVLSNEEKVILVDKAYNNNPNNIFKVDVENTKEKISIRGIKTWIHGPDEKPEIELQLYRKLDGKNREAVGKPVKLDGTGDDKWSYIWSDLDKTDINGKEYVYSIDEVNVPEPYIQSNNKTGNVITITNTYTDLRKDITVEKVWKDGESVRPNSIKVQLLRKMNNEEFKEFGSYVNLSDTKTSHTWNKLDVRDLKGNVYEYKVEELNVPNGFNSSVEKLETESKVSFTVSNTFKITPIDITVEKEWIDGEAVRPDSIQVQLYRQLDGEEKKAVEDPITLSKDGDSPWKHTWKALDKTDSKGNVYEYFVEEANVPDGFKSEVEGTEEGFKITNTFEITPIDITVEKEWIDGEAVRVDSIQVQLYRQLDGEEKKAVEDPITLSKDGDSPWEYTWKALDKTDSKGNVYEYSVEEANVPDGFKSEVEGTEEGFKITNTFEITPIDITVEKEWIDGETVRVDSIQVQLYRKLDGEEKKAVEDPITLSKDGDSPWKHTWKALDKTDSKGNMYQYFVEEANVPDGFTSEVGETEEGFKITNTFEITPIDITVEKEWIDGEAVRPNSIQVQLYRQLNGQEKEAVKDPITLSKDGDSPWKHTWKALDKTDSKGNVYEYFVEEANVPDGFTSVVERTEEGFKISNTYKIPTEGIAKASKEWIGGPSKKPTVWFKLYRQIKDEAPIAVPDVDILELADGTTEVKWTDLEQTDINGNAYTFSVKEVDEEGNAFTPENYEKAENGLKVTNYYVSPTDASAKATKVWVNGPQERPTVWFKLYRQVEGGKLEEVPKEEAEIKELKSGITEVVWAKLSRTDTEGKTYTFSVKEVNAEGKDFKPENYTKSEDKLTVTNTYVIPKTQITGTKVWLGGPKVKADIELQLYRNGEAYGQAVLLKDGRTSYTWSDLDKTDSHGVEYIYTVDEVKVPKDYKKTLSKDGLTVTNTHADYLDQEDDDVPSKPEDESGSGSGLSKTGTKSTWIISILGFMSILGGMVLNRRKRV